MVFSTSEKGQGRIQSVARALALLEFVSEQPQPVRASEAAAALQLNLSTVHHLLTTLVQSGYLDRQGRRYEVSAEKVATLSARIRRHLQPSASALQLMHRLAEETGETAFVASWDGRDVVISAATEGRHAVRVAKLSVGVSGDAHARASGKALLAFRSSEQIDLFLGQGLRSVTRATITDPDRLREELELVRRQGYALDQEEYIDGVCCLSSALREGDSPPTIALSISMPAERFSQMREPYIKLMLDLTRPQR
jgi:DNA-binding IclR family transcriptional regulator